MHFIVLSVLFSVAVSVLLKLARRWRIDVRQAIAVNYAVAALMTLQVLHPAPTTLIERAAAVHAALPVWLALAVLLPAIFLVLAHSVQRVGVARTDAAQRLSLLLPLIAAFTLFGESLSWSRGAGIGIGLAAIGCLLRRPAPASAAAPAVEPAAAAGTWRWPLIVFVGMGAIDILFKQVARLGVDYATSLLAIFALALLVSLLALAVLWLRGVMRPGWRHLAAGLLLGILNFGNILFYILGHRALPADPALVFSAMNIGVIALGAVIGLVGFRERLNAINLVGIALAIVAVLVLAIAT